MDKTILKCMSELTHCLPFHFEQQRALWVQDWYLLPTSWCHWKVQLCCQKCSKVQLCYKRCPLPPHQSCSSSIWDRPYFQSLSVLLLPVYSGSESKKLQTVKFEQYSGHFHPFPISSPTSSKSPTPPKGKHKLGNLTASSQSCSGATVVKFGGSYSCSSCRWRRTRLALSSPPSLTSLSSDLTSLHIFILTLTFSRRTHH